MASKNALTCFYGVFSCCLCGHRAQFKELIWSMATSFEFRVKFNKNHFLLPGKHHVVAHVQLTYYNKYTENAEGLVTSKGIFYSEAMATIQFITEIPGCSAPLGMKSKEINDYQLSASTSYPDAQPYQAREEDDGWCAKDSNDRQYLQIDFMQKTRVTGLTTIRRQGKPHWITEYLILFSSDDINWNEYTENGFTKRFIGNTIDFTPVTHWLTKPFEAVNIRIRPLKWEKLVCFRLEMYGCPVSGSPVNCIVPLGMESGEISDEALSDTAGDLKVNNKPSNARLNQPVVPFPHGWWSRAATPDHLQIDFGSVRRVTRVAVQGAYSTEKSTPYFVSSYKVAFSNDTIVWKEYKEDGQVKSLLGPTTVWEAKTPVMAKLKNPFIARYTRIIPNEGARSPLKIMRGEMYGCLYEPLPPYLEDPEYRRRSFLLDPATDYFYICMYTPSKWESSCFASKDTKEWTSIDPNIISVLASNPREQEIFALDREMNLHRSGDLGFSWFQISRQYFTQMMNETTVTKASSLAENFVSALPTENTTLTTSTGGKWGVSSSNIHFMTAGSANWTSVGSWKCCGM